MISSISTIVLGLLGIVAGRLAWAFLDESVQLEDRTRAFARGVSS